MISNGGTATLGLYDLKRKTDAFGGVDYFRPNLAGGYLKNARVMLANGDIVKSTIDGNTNDPNVDMTRWVLESSKSVSNPSDLATLQNPKNKQRAYVESLQKTFIYDANIATPENGVTVIGKWEMDLQNSYYASWFAEKSITTDQSKKLQTGYAYATSKGRPFIIDDHFYVDSTNPSGDFNGNLTALKTLSNSVMWFTPNGKLEHLPTSLGSYNIIHTFQVENYVIYKPVLIGERDTHTGTTGEWGYLLTIYQSKNGYIHQPICNNAWGDGIYVGKAAGTPSDDMPDNITIFEPRVNRARRNGISFTAGNLVNIIRPYISNTNGIAPEAGIDIEPEEIGVGANFPARITNSIIESPTFINNVRNIWISWYGANRNIDLKFTGITSITGGNYPLTIYARSFATNDTQMGMVYFECIDYTCTTANGAFETELMFEDRGAKVVIDKMIIRSANRWTTHFVRFGSLNKPLKGFEISSIESDTLVNADFATTSVQGDKETLMPSLILGFGDNVNAQTNPDNAGNIRYGVCNIGGFCRYSLGMPENSYSYPANMIIVKPVENVYIRCTNDVGKRIIKIDGADTSIYKTLYIHDARVQKLDGTTPTPLTLTGKGAFINMTLRATGLSEVNHLYGTI